MSRDLKLLVPEFKIKVDVLLERCYNRHVVMQPFFTLRSLEKQAQLWRQSRPTWKVNQKIQQLRSKNAHFLADVIEGTGPVKTGPWRTNAIPGVSWHQWGEAVDCFWNVGGKAVWDTELKVGAHNGYDVYAEEAKHLNLNAGHYWPAKWSDSPHVQLRAESSPLKLYDIKYINDVMKERFGD